MRVPACGSTVRVSVFCMCVSRRFAFVCLSTHVWWCVCAFPHACESTRACMMHVCVMLSCHDSSQTFLGMSSTSVGKKVEDLAHHGDGGLRSLLWGAVASVS